MVDARPSAGEIEVLDDEMVQVLRQKDPAERLAISNRMWCLARGMIFNMLRAENPGWDDARVDRETARRLSHGLV